MLKIATCFWYVNTWTNTLPVFYLPPNARLKEPEWDWNWGSRLGWKGTPLPEMCQFYKEKKTDTGSQRNSARGFPLASVSSAFGCFISDAHAPNLYLMLSQAQLIPRWTATSPQTGQAASTATAATLTGIFPSSSRPRYRFCSHKKSFQRRICFPSPFPEETRGPRGSQKWRMLLEPHCQGAGRRSRSLTARRSHISCTYLGKLIGIGSCSFV